MEVKIFSEWEKGEFIASYGPRTTAWRDLRLIYRTNCDRRVGVLQLLDPEKQWPSLTGANRAGDALTPGKPPAGRQTR